MTTNESTLDRGIRAIVAIVAFVAAFAVGISSFLGIVLAAVGVIMAITAVAGFCPLYRVFGFSTCRVEQQG